MLNLSCCFWRLLLFCSGTVVWHSIHRSVNNKQCCRLHLTRVTRPPPNPSSHPVCLRIFPFKRNTNFTSPPRPPARHATAQNILHTTAQSAEICCTPPSCLEGSCGRWPPPPPPGAYLRARGVEAIFIEGGGGGTLQGQTGRIRRGGGGCRWQLTRELARDGCRCQPPRCARRCRWQCRHKGS